MQILLVDDDSFLLRKLALHLREHVLEWPVSSEQFRIEMIKQLAH